MSLRKIQAGILKQKNQHEFSNRSIIGLMALAAFFR